MVLRRGSSWDCPHPDPKSVCPGPRLQTPSHSTYKCLSAGGGDGRTQAWQILPLQAGCSPVFCSSPETLQITSEMFPQSLLDMIHERLQEEKMQATTRTQKPQELSAQRAGEALSRCCW